MDPVVEEEPRAGQPRSELDAASLARFDAVMGLPIVLAALLPLIIVPDSGGPVGEIVGVISWLVFVVDYVVYERRLVRYTSTWMGRFDLGVVILTAPWYLFPGYQAGSFVVLLRLARLARVVMASKGARRLVERLGRVGLVALGVVMLCSLVAYHAEHATNPEFATYGDSAWWGVVTLTTVGYGDIVPKTSLGRWAAIVIMFTGVAVIGVLAGSLASFFRVGSDTGSDGPSPEDTTPAAEMQLQVEETGIDGLAREVAQLRAQMEKLTDLLAAQQKADPDSG